MRQPETGSRAMWLGLLLAAFPVLLWRLLDFAQEAVEGFKITRGGLEIWGTKAELIELAIIAGSLALVVKAAVSLIHLRSHTPPE
ncbi:hypothetical protein ACNKU3_16230 [Haliea sp. E17]